MTPTQAALSLFLTATEELVEDEAKALGKEFLPGFITRVQNAINNLGNAKVTNFKFLSDIEIDIKRKALNEVLTLLNDALAECNTSSASTSTETSSEQATS
jgi:hypothetical protein